MTKKTITELKNDKRFREDVETLVDYLLEDEEKHWEENDRPAGHIYTYALRVWKELKKTKID